MKKPRFLIIVSTILFCATLSLVMVSYHASFQIPWMYEFSSYADIARNLSQNHTFSQNFVTPMDLAYLEEKNLSNPPWPISHRFPLFPIILAFVFSIFGASDTAVVLTSGFIFGIFVVCIYLLGRLIFPRLWYVSLIASLITALTPIFWKYFVLWGYAPDFLFGILLFLHFGILSLLLGKPGQIHPRHFVLLGMLGFLTYLSRYNFVLFLPATTLIILLQKFPEKKLSLFCYLGAFLGLTVPFVIYWHIKAGGSQSISWTANLAHQSQTASLPWLDYRTLSQKEVLLDILNHPWAFLEKGFRLFVGQVSLVLTQFGQFLVVPFTICALCFGFNSPERSQVKKTFSQLYLAALLIHILFFSFLRVEPLGRYLVWLTPFTLLMGIEYFFSFVERNLNKFRGFIYCTGAFLLLSWFLYLSLYGLKSVYRSEWVSESPKHLEWKILEEVIPPNSLVVSNVGVHLAWYLQRPCIDLPNTMEDLRRILSRYPVRFIYIANWPQGEFYNRPYWNDYVKTPSWKKEFSKEISAISEYPFRDSILWSR